MKIPTFLERILARVAERIVTVIVIVVVVAGASYLGVTVDQDELMELLGYPTGADVELDENDNSADQWFGGNLDAPAKGEK